VSQHFPFETLTVPDLAERLNTTPGKVRRMLEDNYLAAVRIDGVLRIPAPFIDEEGPLPSLRGTLIVLQDAGFENERAVEWLFEHNEELGRTPIESLLAGHKAAGHCRRQGARA